jgi:hypothetical protein
MMDGGSSIPQDRWTSEGMLKESDCGYGVVEDVLWERIATRRRKERDRKKDVTDEDGEMFAGNSLLVHSLYEGT